MAFHLKAEGVDHHIAFEPHHGRTESRTTLNATLVPQEAADAAEIRTFFYDVLVSTYHIESETAEEISKSWTVGSGRELHKYPARLYANIFGDQAGWVLYKEVHARLLEAAAHKSGGFDPKQIRATILLLCILGAMFLVLAVAFKPTRVLAVPLLILCGALVVFLLGAASQGRPNAAGSPEATLRMLYR